MSQLVTRTCESGAFNVQDRCVDDWHAFGSTRCGAVDTMWFCPRVVRCAQVLLEMMTDRLKDPALPLWAPSCSMRWPYALRFSIVCVSITRACACTRALKNTPSSCARCANRMRAKLRILTQV
eukprot:14413154-Alexandrium_andersonii.AAC.3